MLKKSLDLFSNLSGLIPNPSKSFLFLSGLDLRNQDIVKNVFDFDLGSLPIRYLGVPLISSKLNKMDCMILIEKVTNRIKS